MGAQVFSRHTSAPAATPYDVEGLRGYARSRAAAERSSSSRIGAGVRRGAMSSRLTGVSMSMSADSSEGETVVVVGASGGIGRLVTQRYAYIGASRVR